MMGTHLTRRRFKKAGGCERSFNVFTVSLWPVVSPTNTLETAAPLYITPLQAMCQYSKQGSVWRLTLHKGSWFCHMCEIIYTGLWFEFFLNLPNHTRAEIVEPAGPQLNNWLTTRTSGSITSVHSRVRFSFWSEMIKVSRRCVICPNNFSLKEIFTSSWIWSWELFVSTFRF